MAAQEERHATALKRMEQQAGNAMKAKGYKML